MKRKAPVRHKVTRKTKSGKTVTYFAGKGQKKVDKKGSEMEAKKKAVSVQKFNHWFDNAEYGDELDLEFKKLVGEEKYNDYWKQLDAGTLKRATNIPAEGTVTKANKAQDKSDADKLAKAQKTKGKGISTTGTDIDSAKFNHWFDNAEKGDATDKEFKKLVGDEAYKKYWSEFNKGTLVRMSKSDVPAKGKAVEVADKLKDKNPEVRKQAISDIKKDNKQTNLKEGSTPYEAMVDDYEHDGDLERARKTWRSLGLSIDKVERPYADYGDKSPLLKMTINLSKSKAEDMIDTAERSIKRAESSGDYSYAIMGSDVKEIFTHFDKAHNTNYAEVYAKRLSELEKMY